VQAAQRLFPQSPSPGTGALERTWNLQGLDFSLGKEGRTVLSEAVPDSAASKGAVTNDLGEETGSEEEKERQGTGQGYGFGLDERGRGIATCIVIEHH